MSRRKGETIKEYEIRTIEEEVQQKKTKRRTRKQDDAFQAAMWKAMQQNEEGPK